NTVLVINQISQTRFTTSVLRPEITRSQNLNGGYQCEPTVMRCVKSQQLPLSTAAVSVSSVKTRSWKTPSLPVRVSATNQTSRGEHMAVMRVGTHPSSRTLVVMAKNRGHRRLLVASCSQGIQFRLPSRLLAGLVIR